MTVDMQCLVETMTERVPESDRERYRARIKSLKEFDRWRNLVKYSLGSHDQGRLEKLSQTDGVTTIEMQTVDEHGFANTILQQEMGGLHKMLSPRRLNNIATQID